MEKMAEGMKQAIELMKALLEKPDKSSQDIIINREDQLMNPVTKHFQKMLPELIMSRPKTIMIQEIIANIVTIKAILKLQRVPLFKVAPI